MITEKQKKQLFNQIILFAIIGILSVPILWINPILYSIVITISSVITIYRITNSILTFE